MFFVVRTETATETESEPETATEAESETTAKGIGEVSGKNPNTGDDRIPVQLGAALLFVSIIGIAASRKCK